MSVEPLAEIKQIKQDLTLVLKRLGLLSFVSLKEIEKELLSVEMAFQSRLLLGILRRIEQREDDVALKLFIPAITNWKNHMPQKDLGGLSPFEYEKKYPRGRYEIISIAGLMEEYQATLNLKNPDEKFDIESDFNAFQKEYFDRVPIEQPFAGEKGRLMTVREIIIEERRRNNHPKDSLERIGIKLFAENATKKYFKRSASH